MPMTLVPIATLYATYFQGPISNTDPTVEATIPELIAGIRETTGDLKSRILYIRDRFADEDLFACEESKKQLGCIVFSGRFSRRHHTACTDYNGVVIADIDHIDDAAAVAERLRGQPHIIFTFISPKGNGLKVGVLTNATRVEQHKAAWATVRNHFGAIYNLELDASGTDVSRACFTSYDPYAWCAEQVEPLQVDTSIVMAIEEAKRGPMAPSGERIKENRHQHLIVFQAKMADLGMPVSVIIAASRSYIEHMLDCRDGRVFTDDEIRRGAEGAVAKYHNGDRIEQLVTGMNISAGWRQEKEIEAEVIRRLGEQRTGGTTETAPDPEVRNMDPVRYWPEKLLDPKTWGGAIGAVMTGILNNATRKQPALALACALNAVGTVLGRQVQGPTGLRTNLYNIGACETGGGKEAALNFCKRLFYDAEISQRYLQPEDIASDAAIETHTRAKPSAIWLLDEIGRHLQAINGPRSAAHQSNIITILLALYTKSNSTYLGKAYGDAKKEVTPIEQPCVNIYGTCNPADLYAAFSGADITNGFIPRLMIFHADNHLPEAEVVGDTVIDQQLITWFNLWGTNETALQRMSVPAPIVIPQDEDATALLREFSRKTDALRRKWLKEDPGNVGSAILSRSAEKVGRVALIRACGRCAPDEIASCRITADDISVSIELVDNLDRRIVTMTNNRVSSSMAEKSSKELQSIIDQSMHVGVTRSFMLKKTRLPAKILDGMLDVLIEAGLVFVGPGLKPLRGPPSTVYRSIDFKPMEPEPMESTEPQP
jgi:hypothetical protein